jgi:hypothetical protein
MIYDVDSLRDFGASGLLPPFVKDIKIVEATKSKGLEGVNRRALFPRSDGCERFEPFLNRSYDHCGFPNCYTS